MPGTDWGWLITPTEFTSWLLEDGPEVAVLNKPPLVVCHPSKQGPWSSLIGAAREFYGLPTLHMPFRLDRETSGVWLLAKTREEGQRLQRAVQARQVEKSYLAIVEGEMTAAVTVDRPIGRTETSVVRIKQEVRDDGQSAVTHFTPLSTARLSSSSRGYSLVRVVTETGRLHQIRVHAAFLGHPLVGDKMYGPDETLFVDFLEHGWAGRLPEMLALPRQALHCDSVRFPQLGLSYSAALTPDLAEFCQRYGLSA